jgi:hypothetical protein
MKTTRRMPELFVTAWVLSDYEFPPTFYVGSVEWITP